MNCAGIDIGSEEMYTSIGSGHVVCHKTFTEDLYALRDYLKENAIESVAMEATGPYWIVLFELLESAGFDVWLVDGKETKQVPGRKTDVRDCQWIQQLHSYGLLNRCHVCAGALRELKEYQRIREDHIRSASMHVNHMHKSLIQMNVRLPEVLSQVHGKSGLEMIDAIIEGKRDKHYLLSLCHGRIKKHKGEEVLKALEGKYTTVGLFSLRQARNSYQYYQDLISECDAQIEKVLEQLNGDDELPTKSSIAKRKYKKGNQVRIDDLGRYLYNIFGGRDAGVLPGMNDNTWLRLLAEIGTDLSKWKTEKHFTSWLGLAPAHHRSGKKKGVKSRGRPRAGQIFRESANSLLNSRSIALGAFGRRIRNRKGPAIAVKAVARKLAILYWRLMVNGQEYVEYGVQHYEANLLAQQKKTLLKLAKKLDLKIVPNT